MLAMVKKPYFLNFFLNRHDNLVSTHTLTQCDPPLKNPRYAYGVLILLGSENLIQVIFIKDFVSKKVI